MVGMTAEQQKLVKDMRDALGPEYVTFDEGETVRCRFLDWPKKGQFATEAGAIVDSYYFPVEVDGEEMVLSASSKRLQRLLLPLLEVDELIGKVYDITAIGEGMKRKWTLKRVG